MTTIHKMSADRLGGQIEAGGNQVAEDPGLVGRISSAATEVAGTIADTAANIGSQAYNGASIAARSVADGTVSAMNGAAHWSEFSLNSAKATAVTFMRTRPIAAAGIFTLAGFFLARAILGSLKAD